jgi:hypothetical protein
MFTHIIVVAVLAVLMATGVYAASMPVTKTPETRPDPEQDTTDARQS